MMEKYDSLVCKNKFWVEMSTETGKRGCCSTDGCWAFVSRPVSSKPVELNVCCLFLTFPKQLHITMPFLKDDATLKVKLKEDSSGERLFWELKEFSFHT